MGKVKAPEVDVTEMYCLQEVVTGPLKRVCEEIVDLQQGTTTLHTNERIQKKMLEGLNLASKQAKENPAEGELGDPQLKDIAVSQYQLVRAKLQGVQEGLTAYEDRTQDFKPFDPGEVFQSFYTASRYRQAYCGTIDQMQASEFDQGLCFQLGKKDGIGSVSAPLVEKAQDMTYIPELLTPRMFEFSAKTSVGQMARVNEYEGVDNATYELGFGVSFRKNEKLSKLPIFIRDGAYILHLDYMRSSTRRSWDDLNNEDLTLLDSHLNTLGAYGGWRQMFGRYVYVQTHAGLRYSNGKSDYGYNLSPLPRSSVLYAAGEAHLGGQITVKENLGLKFGVAASAGQSLVTNDDPLFYNNFQLFVGLNFLKRDEWANQ